MPPSRAAFSYTHARLTWKVAQTSSTVNIGRAGARAAASLIATRSARWSSCSSVRLSGLSATTVPPDGLAIRERRARHPEGVKFGIYQIDREAGAFKQPIGEVVSVVSHGSKVNDL